jgi:thioredoxin reductase/Pyruvate/2-oxoacid:ferredoxin oxidoreductase delta subunit
MDNTLAFVIAVVVLLLFVLRDFKKRKRIEAKSREAAEKGMLRSDGPRAQHPHIDEANCIGCAACTNVCPEGDVLAMLGGKAVIVNGYKCIGHSLCAEACPVGAITMVMASPSMGAEMPKLTPEYETTIRNLFIVGELSGLALIKNAINQGRDCIDSIASRLNAMRAGKSVPDILDVLRAIEKKLTYLTLDEGEMGGTVAKYPRQKLVMTSPVEFPMYGKFKKLELSKEDLLAFWNSVLQRVDFKLRQGEKVEDIKRGEGGIFTVVTTKSQYRSHAVILAIGKGGSPRKLGVKGENLPKVMYRLIETDHYIHKKILVVGGGDSAVEAAMGLAYQVGNNVTVSYRKEAFSRIKERNAQRIEDSMRKRKINVIFNSAPVEFKQNSVVLEVNGSLQEIPNDSVWIFAGGEPPTAFLKKIGVGFGMHDMTSEAGEEARDATLARKQQLVEV